MNCNLKIMSPMPETNTTSIGNQISDMANKCKDWITETCNEYPKTVASIGGLLITYTGIKAYTKYSRIRRLQQRHLKRQQLKDLQEIVNRKGAQCEIHN